MASINDLATAATIASSAAATQEDNTAPTNPSATPESPKSGQSKDMEEAVQDEIRVRDSSPPTAESPNQNKDAIKQGEEPPVEKPAAVTPSPDAAQAAAPASSTLTAAAAAAAAAVATETTSPVAADPATPEPSKAQTPPTSDTSKPQDTVEAEAEQQPAVDNMDGVEHTSSSATAADMATTAATAAAAAAAAAATAAADSNSTRDKEREREERERLKTKPVRGAFIVFEGMDRAGKTTQAKLLQQRCIESGRAVTFMRFPDRTTTIGQMINAYLQGEAEIEDHVIHLLFTANRWEAAKKIRTALSSGQTIICDRFYHSGIVYSAAKQLPSLSLSWAKNPEIGLPRPDMVLFLDLEETTARQRGGWGGEVYEKGEMQRRVRELFWGLSMGDLGSSGGQGQAGQGVGHGRRRSSSLLHHHHHHHHNGGREHARRTSVASGGNNHNGGSSAAGDVAFDKPFGQEEEDIQIVDAALGVEEMSEKVWEVVLPKLEEVEKGEVGREVRTVN